jgi:hypothetical protein
MDPGYKHAGMTLPGCLAVGCWLLAAGCWLLAVGCWLLAAGCWLTKYIQVFMLISTAYCFLYVYYYNIH